MTTENEEEEFTADYCFQQSANALFIAREEEVNDIAVDWADVIAISDQWLKIAHAMRADESRVDSEFEAVKRRLSDSEANHN